MRRQILTLAAAAALMVAACSSGSTATQAPPASTAPSTAASSGPSTAPSAAPSLIPSEYGTITPLKPAVDLSTVGGQGEGALNLIIWAGYAESGQNVPEYDWVTAFQNESGCEVSTKIGNTSDEMVTLMRSGGGSAYDGVSASGDATGRLIANGDVAAIDPATIPGLATWPHFSRTLPTMSSMGCTMARPTAGAATPCSIGRTS